MNKQFICTLALALCLGATAAPECRAAAVVGQPVDLTVAAERSVNSVVYIKVMQNEKVQTLQRGFNPFEDFFGDFFGMPDSRSQQPQYRTMPRVSSGSGVILSADGYIVTNNHVVNGADQLDVKLNDNREFKARIIGTDPTTDLALIKIEADNLPAITVGNSDNLKVGEWVLAVGNPFNLTSTVTAGIVSAKARNLGAGGTGIGSFIQTDAAINPGNSGGALVNSQGELVGINAMIYSQTGSYSGYGFAIPTAIMNKVVSDLKQFGTVQRALLGVIGQDVDIYIDTQKSKGKEVDLGTVTGVYVSEVSADGAAADAGLEEGDVIIAIDGQKIEKMSQLQEMMVNHNPGDKVSITYLRDKSKHTKTVTLKNAQGTTDALENVDVADLGVALRPLKAEEKQQLSLDYGLLVTAIRSGKMQDAGITKGIIIMQINDQQMRTMEDFEKAVKNANMSNDRVLWIRSKTQSGLNKSFTVELSDPKENDKKK